MKNQQHIALIILDGWGVRKEKNYNAILAANTPVWDNLLNNGIVTNLNASSQYVGLPIGQMGNSEVGHITIGAGRVIKQDLVRINDAIHNNYFFNNKILINNIKSTIKKQKNIHILGLLSDGGVHSHISHLYAILKTINNYKTSNTISRILVHAFLDGRDTPPYTANKFITKLANQATIATICGRFFAMDRDNRTGRTKKIYDLLTNGVTSFLAKTPLEGLQQAYARNESDEFVSPTKIIPNFIPINDDDLVIFYNFRADRARQLCYSLVKKKFSLFKRVKFPQIKLLTFTKYANDLTAEVIFPPIKLKNTLSEYLSNKNLTQLKIAETEKYPHITFFFNGGQETSFPLENRILIPSPKVTTYDLCPQMSALPISKKLIAAIKSKKYNFIVCNFANADMVGHTGNINATIAAIETLDLCLGKIIAAAQKANIDIIITADHGNAELMYDQITNQSVTTHTTSLVPFIYLGNKKMVLSNIKNPSLQDLAPTILKLLNIKKPKIMTGNSLLQYKT